MIPRLILISPGSGSTATPWIDWLNQHMVSHDQAAVLIREPDLTANEVMALVADLQARWRVIIHCKTAGFAQALARWPELGIHVPLSGWDDTTASIAAGLRGVSCHDPEELNQAFRAGADYALLSPIFPPTSKPNDSRATIGIDGLINAAANRPVLGLGGIDTLRLIAIWQAGGYGGAVLGDVLGAKSFAAAQHHWAALRAALDWRIEHDSAP